MVQPRVIPILTYIEEKLVKTVKFKNPNYIGDPINAVKLFNELEIDELAFLDIRASKNNSRINFELIKAIASECFMPVAYGGGIKELSEIKTLFSIGVEKIILNSAAIANPNLIREAANIYGSQSILVSIDVKKNIFSKYVIYSKGGSTKVAKELIEFVEIAEKNGTGEIIINSIDNDGLMNGFDIDLINKVAKSVGIPVIALGGAGSLDDFKKAVLKGGASAVGAGSMFVYHGREKGILINYPAREELENLFMRFENE